MHTNTHRAGMRHINENKMHCMKRDMPEQGPPFCNNLQELTVLNVPVPRD